MLSFLKTHTIISHLEFVSTTTMTNLSAKPNVVIEEEQKKMHFITYMKKLLKCCRLILAALIIYKTLLVFETIAST